MKIGLLIEDVRGKEAFILLSRRILGKGIGIEVRSPKGASLLDEKKVLARIQKNLLQDHPDLSKILICVDKDCVEEREREVRDLERRIKKKIKKPIFYILVTHAFEGWLLGDLSEIQEYLHSDMKISPKVTLDCNPKDEIKKIFEKAGKEYLSSRDAHQIAKRIDLEEVARNNESFGKFREKVIDP